MRGIIIKGVGIEYLWPQIALLTLLGLRSSRPRCCASANGSTNGWPAMSKACEVKSLPALASLPEKPLVPRFPHQKRKVSIGER